MDALADILLDPAAVITIVSGLATLLALLGFLLPYIKPDRMHVRLAALSNKRRDLRAQQIEALQRRSSLRRDRPSLLRTTVERIKLRELVAGEDLKHKLLQANWRGPNAVTVYVLTRLLVPLSFSGLGALVMFGSTDKTTFLAKIIVIFLAFVFGFYLPQLLLKNAIQHRQIAFQRAFPDALDLLTICVESGLSIEAAFGRVAQEISASAPVLTEEFELTTAELAYLPERRLAFENLAHRTGLASVRAVVTSLVQAEKYGTPLATALRVAAGENRDNRMTAAEKKAAALPAKLTVPMIVFFLPVLFVVILGPSAIQIMNR